MAVTPRTRGGLARFRPAGPGSRVALVAPASPFQRAEFEAGLAELRALDFVPVFDDRVFEREAIVAGPASIRAAVLAEYLADPGIDAVLAVRGGSGSAETLPLLDPALIRSGRTAFVGYSDVTAVHAFLNCHAGLASVHGPMIEGRLAAGPSAYDRGSFLSGLSTSAAGPLAPEGLEILRTGEGVGPLFGGTLTQLAASLGTPFAFQPPAGSVLLIDEVGERPYRLRRLLTQLAQAGVLARASAVVFGQLPRCDEPGGELTARAVVADWFREFPGPVLFGFPTGHATSPLVTVPLGVDVRVIGTGAPALVVEESAAF